MLALLKLLARRLLDGELSQQQFAITQRDAEIATLKARLHQTEATRHDLVEKTRYVIEAAGEHFAQSDKDRGEELKALGEGLPYLLSGRRHWIDFESVSTTERAVARARRSCSARGFALPKDPVEAVKAMLDVSMQMIQPSWSVPIDGLKSRYPLASATGPQQHMKRDTQ